MKKISERSKQIKQLVNSSSKVAYAGLMLALSVVIGYVEFLIPINIGVPGIKLGLANTVSLILLYIFGVQYALFINVCRIILLGFLFGNMTSVIYGITGTIFSLTIMLILKKTGRFSIVAVSATGAVFHNIGQLISAYFLTKVRELIFYVPVLMVFGLLFGITVGAVSNIILKTLRLFRSDTKEKQIKEKQIKENRTKESQVKESQTKK